MITELLPNGWRWWRIAEAVWSDPLDPDYARTRGGRWNPPESFPTLYLNEDQVTARHNLRRFIARWPYEPEDLRADTGPVLAAALLPRDQTVCDAHTPAGIAALDLPATYPVDRAGRAVPHARCQPIGVRVKDQGLRGVRARSAQTVDGVGRELAWFPASTRSRARLVAIETFDEWYWG
ncbi:MAG: RES family NAD+ phosphorylase [Pseudomonadales bacterium]|nr:RES family NAD+ phosphorylase [Pseudomonadales bacterium]